MLRRTRRFGCMAKTRDNILREAASTLASLLEHYASAVATEEQLCAWIQENLYERLTSGRADIYTDSMMFGEASIFYVNEPCMFCVHIESGMGCYEDACFPLATFISKGYGVPINNAFLKSILISYLDTVELAEDITMEIQDWLAKVGSYDPKS